MHLDPPGLEDATPLYRSRRCGGRSLSWQTSSPMTYKSSSAMSDFILAPFGLASARQCSRPPRSHGNLRISVCGASRQCGVRPSRG